MTATPPVLQRKMPLPALRRRPRRQCCQKGKGFGRMVKGGTTRKGLPSEPDRFSRLAATPPVRQRKIPQRLRSGQCNNATRAACGAVQLPTAGSKAARRTHGDLKAPLAGACVRDPLDDDVDFATTGCLSQKFFGSFGSELFHHLDAENPNFLRTASFSNPCLYMIVRTASSNHPCLDIFVRAASSNNPCPVCVSAPGVRRICARLCSLEPQVLRISVQLSS